MDVESVDAGFLCSIVAEAGQTVKVGQKIAVIADAMGEC
jgi:pyruvate/2-oxoglutarate dehydrogenase complex dihydrolipoamide acyltransferase (E2) component